MIYLRAKPLNNKKIGYVLVLEEFNDQKKKVENVSVNVLNVVKNFFIQSKLY